MGNIKPRPNRAAYLKVLRSMSGEEKVLKAIELGETSRAIFKQGLRHRFPDLSDEELHQLYLKRLAKCHNKNY